MAVDLWTFVSESGRDALHEWAKHMRLPNSIRATLDQRLDTLRRMPFDLIIHTNLIAPISKNNHIYKLRLNGSVALRLMLCRGPLPGEVGYTLLLGAVERDRKLVPSDAPQRAAINRGLVIEDPAHRRKRHEGFGKATYS